MDKNQSRLRRAKATRMQIKKLDVARLSVHRSGQHLYAQVFAAGGEKVVAAALDHAEGRCATTSRAPRTSRRGCVGKAVAEKALAAGITSVAFDRSGFRYHGRIAALADRGARSGLEVLILI
jgi:large subunit ribosomal protein L18